LLGDTTVNRLVQKAIETHLRLKELSVLDVGCGVGGTLYGGLLTGSSDGGNTTKHTVVKGHSKFENSRTLRSYHGIAVSEAEIFHAQALADHYRRLGHLQQGPSIRFERRSFDDRLEERSRNGTVNTTDSDYSVMIAVESLTYSRDLRKTLLNLLPRLRTGGIMVVVDDVVLGSDDADRRIAVGILGRERPSLVTHSSWESFLRDAGCPLLEGYDLTFEHDLLVSPEDDDRSACEMNDPSRSSWFSVLASFVASKANTLWRTYGASSWWWGFASSSSAAAPGKAARMAQLHYDLARLRRVSIRRQEEYSVRGSLGYHLYVCRKV
jgi:SAM-dependent methyltransferase